MSRRDNERVARIEAGIETSISARAKQARVEALNGSRPLRLFCWRCGATVDARDTRAHIKSCWRVKLRDDEPIPAMRNRLDLERWLARRSIFIQDAHATILQEELSRGRV
jgi:hypothetical protein